VGGAVGASCVAGEARSDEDEAHPAMSAASVAAAMVARTDGRIEVMVFPCVPARRGVRRG
jgi:hypothetical protein